MSKKPKTEVSEFDTLKELGFELEAPQDEYSYQPDSGSVADGVIGKQEYGIDVDLDAEGRGGEHVGEVNEFDDSSVPIPGESEWSQQHRQPVYELARTPQSVDDGELFTLVHDRLSKHPHFNKLKIAVHVESGAVRLRGGVPTEGAKILATEIIEALSGVTEVTNDLRIVQ